MLAGAGERPRRRPPWLQHSGWPFVSEGWTLGDEERRALRVDVNDALDNGTLAVDQGVPPVQRLEVLVDVLLDFLRNLDDGVITREMWADMEADVFAKAGRRDAADVKMGLLEVLSRAPSHCASFILLTSMLARVVQEVSAQPAHPVDGEAAVGTAAAEDLPPSPRVKVRRKTLDRDRRVAMRQLMEQNVAAVFADVLVRTADPARWLATEARRRELVALFLDTDIP